MDPLRKAGGESVTTKGRRADPVARKPARWSAAVYECVTRPGGPRRAESHAGGKHRDGCWRTAPCGCKQRFFSTFLHKPSDAGWRNDSIHGTHDYRCLRHFRRFCANVKALREQEAKNDA